MDKFSSAHKRAKEEDFHIVDATEDNPSRVDEFPITDHFFRCTNGIRIREPQGRRYKKCEKYFILLSFMGLHYYGLLHTTLMFPAYRTVQIHKKQIFDEISPFGNIFDGDEENIVTVLKKCLQSNFNSKSDIGD